MKKTRLLFVIFAVLIIAALGCANVSNDTMESGNGAVLESMEKRCAELEEKERLQGMEALERDNEIEEWSKCEELEKDTNTKEETPSAMIPENSEYAGKVLAGKSSLYLEFNKSDYEKALKENKKLLLYFYANWCPICREEQREVSSAFNELNDEGIVGFRVNYKDSDTNSDEESMAKEFGIAYQHTKVILKDGKMMGKWPDSWKKQRYLDELTKV